MLERSKFSAKQSRKSLFLASSALASVAAISQVLAGCSGGENKVGTNDPTAVVRLTEGPKLTIENPTQATTPSVSGEILIRNSEKAVFNLGNLEVAVTGWEVIEDMKLFGMDQAQSDRDFESFIVVDLVVKNISDSAVDVNLLGRHSSLYKFLLVNTDGKIIESNFVDSYVYARFASGKLTKPYEEDYFGNGIRKISNIEVDGDINKPEYIPPHLAFPAGVLLYVPKGTGNVKNLGIAIRPLQTVLPNPHDFSDRGDNQDPRFWTVDPARIIRVGEVAQNFSLLPQDLVRHPLGESVDLDLTDASIPMVVSVKFDRTEGSTCCKLTARFGSQLPLEYETYSKLFFNYFPMFAFLNDGRVVTLGGNSNSIFLDSNTITVNRYLSSQEYSNCRFVEACWQDRVEPVDFSGSTIVGLFGPNQAVAWNYD